MMNNKTSIDIAQNDKISFLSANAFPIKILSNKKLLSSLLDKKIILPIHIQLIPTNRCNFNCYFCSCRDRYRDEELDYGVFLKIMKKSKIIGCQAVTITGGGEPLMHPKIGQMINAIKELGMEVSLTTNGVLLSSLKKSELKNLTWCRISAADVMTTDLRRIGISPDEWFNSIAKVAAAVPCVDWAFSYVVTEHTNFAFLKRLILFANSHNFTHIRITPDLLNLKRVPQVKKIQDEIKELGIASSRIIYQERKNYRYGNKDCFVSLLKPLIGADNWIYPCCGTQYAKNPPVRDNDRSMRICKAIDIDKFYKKQIPFDGSGCQRCYYSEYNNVLQILLSGIKHKKFI